jgi:hypothetical protein
MPTQVVEPSVSLATVSHGTALTVLVETPSSPTLSRPVVVLGSNEVPGAGATPASPGGVVTAGGGAAAVQMPTTTIELGLLQRKR